MGISSLNSLQLNLLLAGIILLHVGAFMVKLFWFPRPKGTAPFCKRCSYNLQGLQSEQCPECGIYLTSNNIIRGQRLRRPRLTLLALFILLLGLLAAWFAFNDRSRRFGWYEYKPTPWERASSRTILSHPHAPAGTQPLIYGSPNTA